MNISRTINAIPARNLQSFGNTESPVNARKPQDADRANAYTDEKILQEVDKINAQTVNAEDVKSPVEAAISIAASIAGIYATGKIAGGIITKAFGSAPVLLESTLKKGSKCAQDIATKLSASETGKFVKGKKIAGQALQKAEAIARDGYKKVAYSKIPAEVVGAERANLAFQKILGLGAVATTVPDVLKRDGDNNGIKDIMQKSQNAYTGSRHKFIDKAQELSVVGEILSAVT